MRQSVIARKSQSEVPSKRPHFLHVVQRPYVTEIGGTGHECCLVNPPLPVQPAGMPRKRSRNPSASSRSVGRSVRLSRT